jgi:hypothetical protein
MPAASTSELSMQVLDFEDLCPLIQLCRLLCGFCSSGQRFAYGFLQIPPRDGHPCRSANDSPCRVRRGLSPPSECALPGAQRKWLPNGSHNLLILLIGAIGFEPTTSRSRTERSTRLSHAPLIASGAHKLCPPKTKRHITGHPFACQSPRQ